MTSSAAALEVRDFFHFSTNGSGPGVDPERRTYIVPADKRVWSSIREPGGQFSPPVAPSEPINGSELAQQPTISDTLA